MAYGARLESVLGASPRGFESPILRDTPRESLRSRGFSLQTPEYPNISPSASPPAASSFGKVAAASVVVILYS